jgi:UDP-2,4-diacetamido-2,4,6-trideoxy-beta-L-altropyranose hydrolase
LIAIAEQYQCETGVIDSYRVDRRYMRALVDRRLRVVLIDDLARDVSEADVIVNGGAQACALDYSASPTAALRLLGAEYALVRRDFWDRGARVVRPTVEHVLVTLGGSPPVGVLSAVVRAIDDIDGQFSITVVRGPFASEEPPVTRHVRRILTDPATLPSLLAEADLAVCGGGQTLYELAACGTPGVAIELADNQSASLAAVAATGATRVAGVWGRHDVADVVAQTVRELVQSRDLREAMSRAGQRLIDGRGARRVAAALLDRINTPVEAAGSRSARA